MSPWPVAIVVTVVAIAVVFWFLLPSFLPRNGLPGFWDFGETFGQPPSPNERAAMIEARVDSALVLVQMLTLVALAFAGVAGFLNYRQAQRELDHTKEQAREQMALSRQSQVNERFTRAIGQLGAVQPDGSAVWETRLGGIYALERIAVDFPDEYYGPIMEVLTAYVRGHCAIRPSIDATLAAAPPKPTIEVQAILNVIGRRSIDLCKRSDIQIDLGGADLRGASLRNANLRGANLQGTRLEGVSLVEAHLEDAALIMTHLEGANLRRAHLQGANLRAARLEGANLQWAFLDGAVLSEAHMRDAVLIEARLCGARIEGTDMARAHLDGANGISAYFHGSNLRDASLQGADLSAAHFEGADLQGAHLEGANLNGAHLERSDLRRTHLEDADMTGVHLAGANLEGTHLAGALGLTQNQISACQMNLDTLLPEGIEHPLHPASSRTPVEAEI
jgi:uncharacterized protein YjbI with pentapeptide repeats